MQTDGNFVLYDTNNSPYWFTNTYNGPNSGQGNKPYRLTLQDDRNLVIYNKSGIAIWNSGTNTTLPPSTSPMSTLQLQPAGLNINPRQKI